MVERANRNRRRVGMALWLIGAAIAAAGTVAVISSGSEPADSRDWAGTVLSTPQSRPEIVLSDVEGAPVDLGADTDAEVTLVMFGYTNCPDICPISLATLTSALATLPPADANKVRMYFVTADPERDTPEVLADYMDGFDRRFVGLTGSLAQIESAQELAEVPPAVREEPDENGDYAVGHATQMIAYQRDGLARIVYPFGTREGDWVRDLPRLIAGEHPTVDAQ